MQKKPIYSPDRAKVTRQPKARKIGVNMSSDAKKRPLSKEGWWHATSTMLPCHDKDPKLATIVVHLCTILGTRLLRDHFSWAAPGNSLQSTIVKLLLPRSGLFCAGPASPGRSWGPNGRPWGPAWGQWEYEGGGGGGRGQCPQATPNSARPAAWHRATQARFFTFIPHPLDLMTFNERQRVVQRCTNSFNWQALKGEKMFQMALFHWFH